VNLYQAVSRSTQSPQRFDCRFSAVSALIFLLLPLVASAQGAAARDTRLVDAVHRGDQAAVRQLLQARVDVNAPGPDGGTALLVAAERDDAAAVELLLGAKADVKAANRYGITPIIAAAINGNAAIIERLLASGADVNTTLPEGETALMTAARTGRVAAVRALLARGADVNAKEPLRGQSALMWAAAENKTDVVRALVEAGADVKVRSNGGFTPFLFAIRAGRTEAARALLELGADPNEIIQTQAMAAGRGAPGGGAPGGGGGGGQQTLAQVFNTGLRGRGTGTAGASALQIAIVNAHFELAAELLERGADPNSNGLGWTPLHQLAWTRRPPIQHGLPPAVPTGRLDSLDLAKKLLEKGANPNARMTREPSDGARNVLNRIGSTPFLQAAKLGDIPYMRLLLANGADPSIATEEGATPLMAAAGVGIWQVGESAGSNEEAFEAVKICIEAGNDVNAVDANGYTALHGAAHRGSNDIVKLLVEKGAKLNVVNTLGWTPWIIADGVFYPNTYNRRLDTAAVLLELGADPKVGKRRPEDLPPSEASAIASRP
jgi:ankyrin repeat protein